MAGQSLEGKVAVVTGAGRGIGRAIATALVEQGARVAMCARSSDELAAVASGLEGAGGEVLTAVTDLRDPGGVEEFGALVEARWGPADILVSNAGVGGSTSVLWETALDDWEDTLRVNVTGTFLLCRSFLPSMIARGSGSVIVIGSMTGKRALYGRTAYATSKMALVGLVRTLAWETGPYGVRANLISPGAVAGPRMDSAIAAQSAARGISEEQVLEEFSGSSPLGRLIAPEDIAAAVVFLAGDRARSLTGEDLNVSAGMVMF